MTWSIARAAALTVTLAPPLVALRLADPNDPGHYPTCPVKLITGLDCPGCGSLRALHSLTTGDLPGALDHNGLLVVALPLLALAAVAWVRGRQPRLLYRPDLAWAVLTVTVAWAVLRNLPFTPFQVLSSS